METPGVTPSEFMTSLASLKGLSRNLYESTAACTGSDGDLRTLLLALASDEEEHARRVRSLAHLASRARFDVGTAQECARIISGLELALAALSARLAPGVGGGGIRSAVDAAAEVERRMAGLRPEGLDRHDLPWMWHLLSTVTTQDLEHLGRLERVLHPRPRS